MVDSSFLMLSFEPWPIDIMMMTAETPMMMPSMERNERILLFATAFMLTLNRLVAVLLPIFLNKKTISSSRMAMHIILVVVLQHWLQVGAIQM
jgi:hypothetical protein